jgi:hypothetical protein
MLIHTRCPAEQDGRPPLLGVTAPLVNVRALEAAARIGTAAASVIVGLSNALDEHATPRYTLAGFVLSALRVSML